MKVLINMVVGIFASIISNAQPAVTSVTEAVNSASETATNPDSMIWIIGAVLVVLFIFIIIVALSKGAIAMTENYEVDVDYRK